MSLEDITAGQTIANLITTNPAGDDDVGQGDDHIRNVKKAVKYTFPNISATVVSSHNELNIGARGGTVSGTLVVKGSIEGLASLTVSATALFKTGLTITKELNVGGVSKFDNTAQFNSVMSVGGTLYAKSMIDAAGVINARGGIDSPVTVSFAYAKIDSLVLTTVTATASGTVTTTITVTSTSQINPVTPSWSAITFLNGWSKSSSVLDTEPGWYKDTTGRVWMRGRFQIPVTYNAVITVLPADAWPLHQIQCFFPQMDVTPGTYMSLAAIDISGTVRVASGNNITGGGQGCLDGMQYMTLS